MPRLGTLCIAAILVLSTTNDRSSLRAEDPAAQPKPAKLLLLAQGPDGHPEGTHEYRAGQRVLKKLLSTTPQLDVEIVEAGDTWPEKTTALDEADGVVLFLSEGAKWISADERRKELFARYAQRGGGLTALHWATGTRTEEPIETFVNLLGACHGGKDRKYKVLETKLSAVAEDHRITQGLESIRIQDEFYYDLKHTKDASFTPLLNADIDGAGRTVAWAWERSDGGRSFGFTGLHFHDNWAEPFYQRLVAQGVLWTIDRKPPEKDFPAMLEQAP